ncbi:hydroxyisourate hydrolase [Streptosporangiaceae bacterium NEAU-GS5]|nr:hydroxyisourate hydrolase [Streptosporangiaceae bacterium NEAU-GS5]
MTTLSTHVLDTALGRPAADVPVRLACRDQTGFAPVAEGRTDEDGRIRWHGEHDPGTYRLTFDVAAYLGPEAFFPEVAVVFQMADHHAHYHVPLLLSPYGYSTYRGS